MTDQWCTVDAAVYRIVDLQEVGVRRGPLPRPRVHLVVGLGVVAGLLLLSAAAIISGWTRQASVAAGVAVLATVALTALPALAAAALRRPYQIWARHRGAAVLLFATRDHQQHGQVARALMRALEHQHDA